MTTTMTTAEEHDDYFAAHLEQAYDVARAARALIRDGASEPALTDACFAIEEAGYARGAGISFQGAFYLGLAAANLWLAREAHAKDCEVTP